MTFLIITFVTLILTAASAYLPINLRWIRLLGIIGALIGLLAGGFLTIPVLLGGTADLGAFWNLDKFAALMFLMISFVHAAAALACYNYIGTEYELNILSDKKVRLYYLMMPLFVLSMIAAVIANNMGVLWIALEATTLTTTLLVALYKKDGSVEAAWKYILICSVGISIGLLGVMLIIYAGLQSGLSLNDSLLFSALKTKTGLFSAEVIKWAFVFIFVGIGTKVGFAPMHTWLPDAHSRTPSPISAMLSGILINIALYAILRFKLLTDMTLNDAAWTNTFFLVFGFASIVLTAFVLLTQTNYKRMLAYHSIEHMGLIAFAIGLGPVGTAASIIHMIGHMLAKTTLFFGAGEILLKFHTTKIAAIHNLFKTMKYTSILFLFGFLALVAAPTSMIFTSEFIFLSTGITIHPVLTIIVLIALTMIFVGVMQHILEMFLPHRGHGETEKTHDEAVSEKNPEKGEKFSLTHAIMLVEILIIFIGGFYFLTPEGFNFASSIANTILLKPL